MDRREQDILDWVRQETEEIDVPKKLEPENIRRMLEEKEVRERPRKKRRMYRFGFAAAAYVMAWLCENVRFLNYMKLLLISVAGLLVYYGIGVLYYWLVCHILISQEVTWQILLFQCFLLTAGEDFILCVAAVSMAVKLRGVVRRTLYSCT